MGRVEATGDGVEPQELRRARSPQQLGGPSLPSRSADQPTDLRDGIIDDVLISPKIPDRGHAACVPTLDGPGSRPFDAAVCTADQAGEPEPIARTGGRTPGLPSSSGVYRGFESQLLQLNDAGDLTFAVYFTNDTAGVFVTAIPTPMSSGVSG